MPEPVEQPDPIDEESTAGLIAQLRDDVLGYAAAHIQLVRALIRSRAGDATTAAVLIALAIAVGNAVLVTALIGLLLVLRDAVGLGFAIVLIVFPGLVIALLLALSSRMVAKRITRPIKADPKP